MENGDFDKTCTKCGRVGLAAECFYRRSKSKDGFQPKCKTCDNADRIVNTKHNYEREREKWRNFKTPERARCYALKRKYGLTVEQYLELVHLQDNRCAICGTSEPGPGTGTWRIDHDHKCCSGERTCGKCVRGLLCHSCNIGIGNLKDDPDILARAFIYLDNYEASRECAALK